MASRTNVDAGIQIAQLDGRARYHLQHNTTRDVALSDLRAVGATPERIRQAVDSARREHTAEPVANWQSGDVADLLDALLWAKVVGRGVSPQGVRRESAKQP